MPHTVHAQDNNETHVSSMFQGTLSHMAPEVLLSGRMSKAADVYAFGVTLYELFSAGVPYQGGRLFLVISVVSSAAVL